MIETLCQVISLFGMLIVMYAIYWAISGRGCFEDFSEGSDKDD